MSEPTIIAELPWLTEDELVGLTGKKQRAAQLQWLATNGIKHYKDANGKPLVGRAYISEFLGASNGKVSKGPNFAALDKKAS